MEEEKKEMEELKNTFKVVIDPSFQKAWVDKLKKDKAWKFRKDVIEWKGKEGILR